MLTQDQLLRLAAREAHAGQQVFVPADLEALKAYLPARIVVSQGGAETVADLAFVTPGTGYGGDTAHQRGTAGPPSVPPARRRVLVVLDGEVPAHADILDGMAHASNGHTVERIVARYGVVDVMPTGLVLRQLAPGVSAREVQATTRAQLLAGPDLAEVEVEIGAAPDQASP